MKNRIWLRPEVNKSTTGSHLCHNQLMHAASPCRTRNCQTNVHQQQSQAAVTAHLKRNQLPLLAFARHCRTFPFASLLLVRRCSAFAFYRSCSASLDVLIAVDGVQDGGARVYGQVPAWEIEPMSGQCWPTVFDGGPASSQHWFDVSCPTRYRWLAVHWHRHRPFTSVKSDNRNARGPIYTSQIDTYNQPVRRTYCYHAISHLFYLIFPTFKKSRSSGFCGWGFSCSS